MNARESIESIDFKQCYEYWISNVISDDRIQPIEIKQTDF